MPEPIYFDILFEDEDLIAINKPCGILVHRTKISEDTDFVLQRLRNQIKRRIYPIHRLDRATSGVLIFGKNKNSTEKMSIQFREKTIEKKYLAITRGFVEEAETINYPLAPNPQKPKQEAITYYKKLHQVTLPVAIGRYETARYSLVEVFPKTGRSHQIRRHFSHLRHPVIGDKRHGDIHHNKYWAASFGVPRMLLHAQELGFVHPTNQEKMIITAPLNEAFEKALKIIKWNID